MFLLALALSFSLPASADQPAPTAAEEAPAWAVDLQAPVHTVAFSGEQINRLASGNHPTGILRLVPGVTVRGGQTWIGGASLRESAVMLDGVVLMHDGRLGPRP